MKRFLSESEAEKQAERLEQIKRMTDRFSDICDYRDGVTKKDVVACADRLIKLIKKAKKVFIHGGFSDVYNLAHDAPSEEPPFADPTGKAIPEFDLEPTFRMASIVRPKTTHLKLKKRKK